MARVLILANDNSTIYNFRRELLRRLVNDGFDVTVALPAHDRNQAFRELGCVVVDTPVSRFGTNPLTELATLVRFAHLIRQVKPDVVLTYTAKPNIYGGLAAQLCRVPYIATVTGLGAAFQSDGPIRRISSLLQRFAFRKARRVFFQNSDNLATFRRLAIVSGQAGVLPGSGVNLDLHRLEPYAPDLGRTRFITVARIRRDKGYDELFEAIRKLSTERNDVEFHIVGWYEDETYRDTVAAMQADYPVFIHHGVDQERVHELIAASHCLIHPSHHEGMPNVVLEASAAGVPCIVSDIPGCRDAVDDEVTGLVHTVRDTDALIASVERFLSFDWETRQTLGLAARRKMEAKFDREKVVDRYLAEVRRAGWTSMHEVGV